MKRGRSESTEAFGSDSFLDVVANIVGILIILVMSVGIRLRQAPAAPEGAPAVPSAEVEAAKSGELAAQGDNERLLALVKQVEQELSARSDERLALGAVLEEAKLRSVPKEQEPDPEAERKQIESEHDELFAQLTAAEAALEKARQPTLVSLQAKGTPLAKSVDGKTWYLRIKGKRIAAVPLERIDRELALVFREKVTMLEKTSEYTGTLNPIEGWRVRYEIRKIDPSAEDVLEAGRRYSVGVLSGYQILPTTSQMGETLEEALRPGSDLRRWMRDLTPGASAVTIWVYPDSFAEYRAIRDLIYEQGMEVAARPMLENAEMAVSIFGSKSHAQ